MSTTRPEIQTTIQWEGYQIGATFHQAAAQASARLNDSKKGIIGPKGDTSTRDLVLGCEIAFSIDSSKARSLGITRDNMRTFGKPLFLVSTADLPHGIPEEDCELFREKYGDDWLVKYKREKLESNINRMGITQTCYYPGKDGSPLQDGVVVLTSGQSTVCAYMTKPISVGTQFRFKVLPLDDPVEGMNIKLPQNDMKVPLIMEPWSTRGATDQVVDNLKAYAAKLRESNETKKVAVSLPCDMSPYETTLTAPALLDDKNAATMTYGIMQIAGLVIDMLVQTGQLKYSGDLGNADDLKRSLGLMSVVNPTEKIKAQNSVGSILERLSTGKVDKFQLQDKSSLKPFSAADAMGLPTLVGGTQDAIWRYNRADGRLLKMHPQLPGQRELNTYRGADVQLY